MQFDLDPEIFKQKFDVEDCEHDILILILIHFPIKLSDPYFHPMNSLSFSRPHGPHSSELRLGLPETSSQCFDMMEPLEIHQIGRLVAEKAMGRSGLAAGKQQAWGWSREQQTSTKYGRIYFFFKCSILSTNIINVEFEHALRENRGPIWKKTDRRPSQ